MKYSISSKIQLNSGVEIPILGLGTWRAEGKECSQAILWAFEAGYRHIDTAAFYGNEEAVGKAVKDSGLDREEIFITTKLWNNDHGYDNAINAFNKSLKRLTLDYVDLYLIHWPVSGRRIETWKALEKLTNDGKARAIGVSNFMTSHLEELLPNVEILPAINQIEFNPYQYQKGLHQYCLRKYIQLEAFAPIVRARKFEDPKLLELCKKYGKTPAQILLRWAIQHDIIVIPKSIHKERIIENSLIFDFEISDEDMKKLDGFHEDYTILKWNPKKDPQFK
jgi:diketogulonate reductase-like aldo/keto reductase